MPPAKAPQTLVLDRKAVREVDRAAIEDYGISGVVLMENAARGLCEHALRMLVGAGGRGKTGPEKRGIGEPLALIVCGSGNNGGDGYALARHLHNAQVGVVLAAIGEPKPGSDAAANRDICRKMALREIGPDALTGFAGADLIVDALFGTGLDRPIEGPAAAIINWINSTGKPVLAVDVPSGLDCDTGRPLGVCVRAAATVTFVALKPGFLAPESKEWTGRIDVVDIGVPRELVERLSRSS